MCDTKKSFEIGHVRGPSAGPGSLKIRAPRRTEGGVLARLPRYPPPSAAALYFPRFLAVAPNFSDGRPPATGAAIVPRASALRGALGAMEAAEDAAAHREDEVISNPAQAGAEQEDGKKKKRKKRQLTPEAQSKLDLRHAVVAFTREGDVRGGLAAFDAARREGVVPDIQTYGILFAGCCGADVEVVDEALAREAVRLFQDATANGIPLIEANATAYARACCQLGCVSDALALIQRMRDSGIAMKLRTLRPLLHYYSNTGDVERCHGIFEQMRAEKFTLSEVDYGFAFRCCCAGERALSERYFDLIFAEFSEDVLRPRKELLWPHLRQWYGAEGCGWRIETTTVSPDGLCGATQQQLVSIELRAEDRDELQASLATFVMGSAKKDKCWKYFRRWLQQCRHFDCILDAANIGYFRGNYSGAPKHMNYRQVEEMLRVLKRRGRETLLVVHRRHFSKKLMPAYAAAIVDRWEREELMFVVEPGNNDDWYWLFACLDRSALRERARGTAGDGENAGSKEQLWVVTNDLMRDHHFQMLSHRAFQRWRERHQVFYDMGGSQARPEIQIYPPKPYSHRTQVIGASVYIPNEKDGEWLVATKVAA